MAVDDASNSIIKRQTQAVSPKQTSAVIHSPKEPQRRRGADSIRFGLNVSLYIFRLGLST